MNPFVAFVNRARRGIAQLPALMARRWKNAFYIYLATAFSLFVLVDAVLLHATANMRQVAFDMMVRYRIIVPRPDKDIAVVDIDEAAQEEAAGRPGSYRRSGR